MTEPHVAQPSREPANVDRANGAAPGLSPARRKLRIFLRNRAAVPGAILVLILVVVAVAAPWLAPHDPLLQSAANRLKPRGTEDYCLGTDHCGLDTLSRVIWDARVPLQVCGASELLGMDIGLPVG